MSTTKVKPKGLETVDVEHGGTGATTAAAARTALGAGAVGDVLFQSSSVVAFNAAISSAFTSVSTNTTLVNFTSYVVTADCTVTLPATPSAGDWVFISDASGTLTVIVARNGSNIQSIAEDLTLDKSNFAGRFTFVDSTRGWVIS